MKSLTLSLQMLVVAAAPLPAALSIDFNSAGDLSTHFSSSQPGPISHSTSGGLNNSGMLDLTALPGEGSGISHAFTLNPSFSSTASSWSASLYYQGNAWNFWQFGITTAAAPDLLEGWLADGGEYLPIISFGSGSLEGGAIGFTSYSPSGAGVEESDMTFIPGGLPTSANWYQYTIDVTYQGDSNYFVQGSLIQANEDGSLGEVLGSVSGTFNNPDLASNGNIYLYFNAFDGVAIDNFYTDAVPEPSTALLGALGALGLLRRRR